MKRVYLVPGVVLAAMSISTLGTSPAEAKQCIWNKAGFVLNVSWIKDQQVVRHDTIPTAQGVCSDDGDNNPYTIVLSIEGGELADTITRGAIFAVYAALGAAGGSAGAGAGALGGEVMAGVIPDPKSVFYTDVPGQDRYLDVWGTIWDPQTGPGGPI